MAKSTESFRDKMILAAIQTLVFIALLEVLGYFLNGRFEAHRQALSEKFAVKDALLTA